LEEACGFFGCTNWATVAINGTVTDDGNPNPPHRLTAAWSVVSGPGRVDFENRNSAATRATFYVAGHYILRLTGDDSALKGTDDVIVQITSTARPFIRLYEDRNRLCGIDGNELWAENTNTSKTIVFTVRLRYANQLGDEWEELPTFTLSPRQKTYVACTGRGETHWLVNYWLEAANFATGTVLAGSGTLLTQYGLRLADGLLSLDGGFVDWGTVLYDPAPLMSVAESDPRLIAQGVMELRLYGQPDVLYTIQVSSDLRNWTTLTTVLGDTIPVVVRDTQAGANRLRFCRALKP
jgi:hypothetical protein